MNDDRIDSGLTAWLANYPRYPSVVTGGLCGGISAAMLGGAAAGLWTPRPPTLVTGVLALVLGFWIALAGYHTG